MEPRVSERAERAIESYVTAYRQRQRKRKALVFGSREQDALLALFWTRLAGRSQSNETLRSATEAVDGLVEGVFKAGAEHDLGVDIAGYVSSVSFGVLTVGELPLSAVRLAQSSGSGSGAVRGLYGVAWRTLFLAAAWPYFDRAVRSVATTELRRRTEYLLTRTADDAAFSKLNLSQAARVLYVTAQLGVLLGRDDLTETTHLLTAGLVSGQRSDGSIPTGPGQPAAPTAHLAQFVLAASVTAQFDAAAGALAYLLEHRFDDETGRLLSGEGESRAEISPWVALALLTEETPAQSDDGLPVQQSLHGGGLRGWLRGARGRG